MYLSPHLSSIIFHSSLLCSIELFVQQMQKQVDIQPHASLKQIHVLVVGELRSEQGVHGNLSAGSGYLNASFAALDEEDADLVA